MKTCALLLLGLSTTLVAAQDLNLGTTTVGDIQQIYEAEAQKELTQKFFITFFNGYGAGFIHGLAFAMLQADLVDRDVSPDFADCAPNSQRQFYELLAVSDAHVNLNVAQFAESVILDRCRITIEALGGTLDPP